MTTTNATPMVIGGVAEVMKDLKNSPTSMRINSTVKGSILLMSCADPVSAS